MERYVEALNQNGIRSPQKYLEEVTELEDVSEQDGHLSEINFRGLTRFAPNTNQDIAAVFTNPRLSLDDDLSGDENVALSQLDLDDERFSEVSWQSTVGWLRRKGKIRTEFYELVRHLSQTSLVDGPQAVFELGETEEGDVFDEYIDEKLGDQMYLTNWFKLATPGRAEIPIEDDGVVTDVLLDELNTVNPELVLAFGKDPWKESFRDAVDPVTTASVPQNISDAHGHLFRDTRGESQFFVIPFMHPSWWSQNYRYLAPDDTESDESEFGKKEAQKRLKESLRYID